jgi:Tfp pilus assembly protein PilO
MNLSDDFLEKWEHIISGIDEKTAIPLECIKKVIIKIEGRRRKTINLQALKKQGLELDEIELVISRQLAELDDLVQDLEFVLDVNAVAELVQPETNRILSGL